MYELDVSRQKIRRGEVEISTEAASLARFMIWAYDEVNQNLDDDVLKSAIKAILFYMSRRYGVDADEIHALTGVETS